MNYSAKIDLMKFRNAFATNIQGKTSTKRCVCIPIDDNALFVGEKGVFFDINIREIKEENRKYGDTHVIVQSLPKEVYESMSDEQKKSLPVFGGMREMPSKGMAITETAQATSTDDLPF